jgi:hypothetical protein
MPAQKRPKFIPYFDSHDTQDTHNDYRKSTPKPEPYIEGTRSTNGFFSAKIPVQFEYSPAHQKTYREMHQQWVQFSEKHGSASI